MTQTGQSITQVLKITLSLSLFNYIIPFNLHQKVQFAPRTLNKKKENPKQKPKKEWPVATRWWWRGGCWNPGLEGCSPARVSDLPGRRRLYQGSHLPWWKRFSAWEEELGLSPQELGIDISGFQRRLTVVVTCCTKETDRKHEMLTNSSRQNKNGNQLPLYIND